MQTAICLVGLVTLAASAMAVGVLPRHLLQQDEVAKNISVTIPIPTQLPTTPRTTRVIITTTPYVPVYDPTHTTVRIKLDRYHNPSHTLSDGSDCEWFNGCDPYFNILYTSSHDGHLYNITTSKNDNLASIAFGIHVGFPNPFSIRAPVGATIEVQVTALDEDLVGSDELIGMWSFYFVVGTAGKSETKKDASGPAQFGLSFQV
ncbi:hypothetical protein BV898_04090 [Hypsibius exemplaris]|uniref:Uncharacterized protein n=1 Tax=Hypsibius exemplaris TaxID=2072580 RepID=A0A1W0X2Y9_HYPEX|nr:hypothetical protein BV898_04090 [Hypsibius exemplaris]